MEQLNPNTFIPIGTVGLIETVKVIIAPYDSCRNCYLFIKRDLCRNAKCAYFERRDKTTVMFKPL